MVKNKVLKTDREGEIFLVNDKTYAKAMKEVLYIIDNTDEAIAAKIPEKIINLIKEKSDKDYEFNPDSNNINDCLSEESKAIIAVLYRDYLCDKTSKKEFEVYMKNKKNKIDEEKRKIYNNDTLFGNNQSGLNTTEYNKKLIEVKEDNFITRIFKKIKLWFSKDK